MIKSIVSGVAAMQLLFFMPTLNLMTDTLNLLSTCNLVCLPFCLLLFLFCLLEFKGWKIKNPRSTAWITIGFDAMIYAGLTTTPV